jgi:outer membrane protein
MKAIKHTLPLFFLAALAPIAQADTVFGIYAGAGQWQGDYEGDIGNPSIGLNELGLRESDNNFYFVALEHGVPIIPNIKIQQTNIESRQSAVISQTFTLDEITFVVDSEVASEFDLTHTDAVLYYEVLDNWLNLDLGLTLRKFDGFATARSGTARETVNLDETIPMIYGRAQFNLPLSGFAVGGALNAINYSDNKITDYNAYLSYTFNSALDIGAELGYRSLELRADEDNVKVDATIAGPYASILLHF